MRINRVFVLLLLALAGGLALYLIGRRPNAAGPQTTTGQRTNLASIAAAESSAQNTNLPLVQAVVPQPAAQVASASNAGPAAMPAAVEPLPPELANLSPQTVLENMRTVIRQYGSTFGGNPVGTNEEITRALQGHNPKQINFLKADGNRVNASGELVDVWGTPYFFHQLSGTEMEIHSAGPDRRMWTADDLVIK